MFTSVDFKDGKLLIIDQTQLPVKQVVLEIDNIPDCFDAIKKLKVRGAPAIGVAAGYGVVLSAQNNKDLKIDEFKKNVLKDIEYLASSRPTAVNLFWALDRMKKLLNDQTDPIAAVENLTKEAHAIRLEDEKTCRAIGENGLKVLKDGMTILTHCNTGMLATAKYGTALAPVYVGQEQGINIKVYADETRPLLQGSRLTAFELLSMGVDVTLITDNMAAMVMKSGVIDAVIVGCDRVAANGDVANKIGTYGVALLAKAHNIPFYVAGPLSTFDLKTKTGDDIPIEERGREEIICGYGKQTAPSDVKVYNPAFDVTPHELITGLVTEKGIITAPYEENIKKAFEE